MSKKYFIALFVISLVSIGLGAFTVAAVRAQEREVVSIGEVSDPGLLPDSPFYFIKEWGRTLRLFFAFDPLKKADLELKFANEDVLAVKSLCEEKGKCELAEKHCEKFQQRFQRALENMEEAKRKGKDVEELAEKLKENSLRQQKVLAGVLEKVPEQAREGVLRAIEESKFGLEKAIEKVQGVEKKKQYQEQLRLQIQNMGEEMQLKIKERMETETKRLEEFPAGKPRQKEPGQMEPRQKEPGQQEVQEESSNQQVPLQEEPGQMEPSQKNPGGEGQRGR